MPADRRLLDLYLPPGDDFVLESLVATTYKIDWEFVEEDLLPIALGVRSPVSRIAAFRAELERRLDVCDVTILYDLRASDRFARLSPRIDPIPLTRRKLHAKVTLLLWSRALPEDEAVRKRVRLIVGSANLTRQGFRENYEVVSAVDFGGRGSAPRELLLGAVDLVADIVKGSTSERLNDQLQAFRWFARGLAEGDGGDDHPWRLVTAETAVPALEEAWRGVGESNPQAVVVASPFWPEGEEPATPIAALVGRFGVPGRVELVCESVRNAGGKLFVPLLPRKIPLGLRAALSCPVLIRPSTGIYGVGEGEPDDAGELTEDQLVAVGPAPRPDHRRALHAKVIVVRGRRGSALYVGSSNCTRRGLALSSGTKEAASNWEAGFVYRLSPRNNALIDGLLAFAGDAIEVPVGGVATREPEREPEPPAPTFLREVLAAGSRISIRFRDEEPMPPDVVILMPDRAGPERQFLLLLREGGSPTAASLEVALEECPCVNEALIPVLGDGRVVGVSNVSPLVEVRWRNHVAQFPVRFEDRASLPPVPGMRRLTEGELIEYFLNGREPWSTGAENVGATPGSPEPEAESTDPVDTRRILSYFIRRFVEAIPGLEAEVQRAMHSKPALEAAVFGPTSAVMLVERAVEGLRVGPPAGEPQKTAVSVGFQLVEIAAALRRCRGRALTHEGKEVLDRGIERCRRALDGFVAEYKELQTSTFREYRRLFAEEA